MGVGGSLLGEEDGGLDFGERRLEQRLCHLGRNLLIWPNFFRVKKSWASLTERVVVSRTNNDSDKHKLRHLRFRVALAPELKKKKNTCWVKTIIRSWDPGLFSCSHNSALLAKRWLSITSLGKRIH